MRDHRESGLPREVAVLAAVAFAVALGYGIVAPALPVFARHFGVGATAASAVISAFALMRFVSALGGGRLVDRLGERRVLAAGIGIVAVSSALAGLAQSYPQLLVLRGIGGVGSTMFTVSAMSLLLRVAAPDQRARASGAFSAGFLIGGIAGPALGGVVTGVSLRAPFFVYAATLAVAGTIGLFALRTPRMRAKDDARSAAPTPLAVAARSPAFRAATATNLASGWANIGVRSALVPLFVVEALGRSPAWTGIGFVVVAAVNAVALWPAGRVADTRGRRPVIVAGCALSALAMGLLALPPSLPAYLTAMATFGLGSSLLSVAPAAVLGDVVAGRGGSAVATYQMAGDLGVVVGPLVAGWLVDATSFGAGFAAAAAVLVAAGLLALRAPETGRGTSRPEEVAAATASGSS